MGSNKISVQQLREAVDVICNHLIEDLGVHEVKIETSDDCYWEIPEEGLYDVHTNPERLNVGRLSDDAQFLQLVRRGEGADVSYNLVHIAPLLLYVANKIKK